MSDVRLIEIKEEILADNDKVAGEIRKQLRSRQVFMLNLMSSPGGGKTSLIIETLRGLKRSMRAGVIEGDIDSMVDAEKWRRRASRRCSCGRAGPVTSTPVWLNWPFGSWTSPPSISS